MCPALKLFYQVLPKSRDNASPTCVLTRKGRCEFYQDRVFRARAPAGLSLPVCLVILKFLKSVREVVVAQFPEKQSAHLKIMKLTTARP